MGSLLIPLQSASLQHGSVHSYTQVSRDNYEEFLKELGAGFMLRKAALASTPVMTISEDSGEWTMVTKTTLKSIELKFKMGVPFKEETTDGRSVETTVTMEGNKFFTNHKALKDGQKDVSAVREFTDEGLTITMNVGAVTSKQVYKRD